MQKNLSLDELVAPIGVGTVNALATAVTVSANVFFGLTVAGGAPKSVTVFDGATTDKQIGYLDAPTSGRYFMVPDGIALNTSTLTVSAVSASPIMFFYR